MRVHIHTHPSHTFQHDPISLPCVYTSLKHVICQLQALTWRYQFTRSVSKIRNIINNNDDDNNTNNRDSLHENDPSLQPDSQRPSDGDNTGHNANEKVQPEMTEAP
ncbi:conserved hypothetical protein [Trichinella spiralis]|uniref:hypothetical protein n=1 Tax=Trichinella spiralis TaxID=6334 RepID=UPI0001EFBBD6|nr:conserved hypothetical protein [Trichinella spiralis]